jgi:seryl-tRNA synthetase
MTALGKTLTVFVFLLSLVWCWLTVNAFATRTNWKTQAEAAKAQAVAAADRAREWEAEVTSLRAAAEAQAKKLADTIAERDRTIVALQKDNGDLKRDYDRKLAAEKDAEVKAALQLKNNQATLEQINGLKVAKDAVEKKLIDATRSEQAAKDAAKYLGRVRILEVSPKEAVGTFEPAGGGRATGDNRPRPGDLISVLN